MSKLAYFQSPGSLFLHPNVLRRSSQILYTLTSRSPFSPVQYGPSHHQQQQHFILFSVSELATGYPQDNIFTQTIYHPRRYSSRREWRAHGKREDSIPGLCDTEAPAFDSSVLQSSESATAIARRKKKVAIWLAYLGTGYHGEKEAKLTRTLFRRQESVLQQFNSLFHYLS